MWKVSGIGRDSWVKYDGGRLSASPDCAGVLADDDRPVEVAPNTGAMYTPSGPGDQVAMFLRARNAVGWPLGVTGAPPAVPVPAAPAPGPDAPVC